MPTSAGTRELHTVRNRLLNAEGGRKEAGSIHSGHSLLITPWTEGRPSPLMWRTKVCLSFWCHHRTVVSSELHPLAFPGREWTVEEIHHPRGPTVVACGFVLNANETVAHIINCWGVLHFQSVSELLNLNELKTI